jgi:8-oxo-dGTP pyrophosphatase MutT (NUDIX family)
MKKAAGILFLSPKGTALFLKRGSAAAHFPLCWDFPGGHTEGEETAQETALREAEEEIGPLPKGGKLVLHTRTKTMAADGKDLGVGVPPPLPAANTGPPIASPPSVPAAAPPPDDQVDFTTFVMNVEAEFAPKINDEHVGWAWAPIANPPEPLHPGCRVSLDRISMNELGVARAIAEGRLTSPQFYENMWLFAIRITGTDVAYRNTIDEFVVRKPENYLNDEFLARCNGLSVVYRQRSGKDKGFHPKGALLNSEEFSDRVVGAIFLPYISGSEVWGVAKIYDEACASDMDEKQLSTSPAVFFRDVSVNNKLELQGGSTLLIEGNPTLLDHVCICEQGVWDKGGEATGVRSEARGDSAMADEDTKKDAEEEAKKKADAEAGHTLDKTLSHIADSLASMHKRMDAIEESERAKEDAARKDVKRKDDEDEEKKADDDEDAERIAADKAKKDAEEEERKKEDARKKKDAAARKDEPSERQEMAERIKEKEKEGRAKGDAKADSADPSIMRQIEELRAAMPKTIADTDFYALTDAQARADEIFTLFNQRAPRPVHGDSVATYERRCVRELKQYSPKWKALEATSAAFADDASFSIIRDQVYADAIATGRDPSTVTEGTLRAVRTSRGGHEFIEYVGDPRSWMSPMAGPMRRWVKSGLEPRGM